MTKVLVWIEPFPIRGNPTEFLEHALFLAQSMLHLSEQGITFTLFSSKAVVDRLGVEYPASRNNLSSPSAEEQNMLRAFDGDWAAEQQQIWFDLIKGEGVASADYNRMARRVIAKEQPDVIVTWSDNDTLRAAAKSIGCPVLHCELGPTRTPFQPTFYVDPCGTNGAASFRRISDMPAPVELLTQEETLTLADPPVPQRPRLASLAGKQRDTDWLPERPFVFIPLQLADDLNTSLHSDFAGPLHFLEAVIPAILETDYDILLKGHPNVEARASNLAAEEAALKFSRGFGDRVRIAPRLLQASDQMTCIGRSALVCTINSSLGFESMLLGRPCVLLGDAAFDLGGLLHRHVSDLTDIDASLPSAHDQTVVLDAMMRHFLHPKDTGRAAETMLKAIQFVRRHPDQGLNDPDALQDWIKICDHSRIRPDNPGSGHAALVGNLEEIAEQTRPDGLRSIVIFGWIFDAGSDRPAGPVQVWSDGNLLAETEIKTSRPDVARSLGVRTISLHFRMEFETSAKLWSDATLACRGADGRLVRFPIREDKMTPLPEGATRWLPPAPTEINGRKVSRFSKRVERARQWVARAVSRS